jgi:[lysine-biosynthesis-protein LysW]--L-2-aminoadipate ligase
VIIGLAYDLLRAEEKLLIDAARRLGHSIRPIFVPKRIEWLNNTSSSEFGDLGFVLERCVSHYRALSSAIILEGKGVAVVNPYRTIRDCGDKLVTTTILASRGIPVPKTVIAYSRDKAIEAARELGYPVVVKPILGSWGRFIARAATEDDLLDILDFRESMNSPHFKIHYIQQYIDKPDRDIRAFYVWGRVPVAIYRYSKRWKTNTALGGRAVRADLTDEQVELVIRAGDAVGGGVLGVDLMETKSGECLVGEINAVIEFRNTVQVTGYDLAGDIIKSTVEVFKR